MMRVLDPLTVKVHGLRTQAHDFASGDRPLGQLTRPVGSSRAQFSQADGSSFDILALGPWRPLWWLAWKERPQWLLWHGEGEWGQALPTRAGRRIELELLYQAAPYFVLPETAVRCRYRLINEADTEVLSIAFRGPLRREATLCPQVALDLPLVVFAYDLARRLW